MANLLYVAVALALSILGGLVLWLRTRRPRTLESGIEEFSRELRALAPDSRQQRSDQEGRRG